jgi:photosynthetic reaction center H subunit
MIYDTSGVDFALVSLFVFIGFFLMLVIYLRREDRREGYPLEADASGRLQPSGGLLFTANPKTFIRSGGQGSITVPNQNRDQRPIAARRTSKSPGSPLQPTGNPMADGVGPASYAERAKVPALTYHGDLLIVPMRVAQDFSIAGNSDPRGMAVFGTDGQQAGVVKDLWVDRGESMIRYLEVWLAEGARSVMLPITMSLIDKRRRHVQVDAITAAQFAGVPALENPDQITFYEEERVTAYYGGGFLYATPQRAEPLL